MVQAGIQAAWVSGKGPERTAAERVTGNDRDHYRCGPAGENVVVAGGGSPCLDPMLPGQGPRLRRTGQAGVPAGSAGGASWLAQYLQIVASAGRSADLQFGHVWVGGGSPKTVVPRRFM